MRSSFALFALAAALVSAQAQNYTSELDMTIDPGLVEPSEREAWCRGQRSTCQALCDQNTNKNDCTSSTLAWECTCASNDSAPGIQYYDQTVPTFICNELFSRCIEANTQSARGQEECETNIRDLCGTLPPPDPTDAEDDATTTSGTSTATAADSSATEEAVTTTTSGAFAAPTKVPAGNGAAALALGVLAAYLI